MHDFARPNDDPSPRTRRRDRPRARSARFSPAPRTPSPPMRRISRRLRPSQRRVPGPRSRSIRASLPPGHRAANTQLLNHTGTVSALQVRFKRTRRRDHPGFDPEGWLDDNQDWSAILGCGAVRERHPGRAAIRSFSEGLRDHEAIRPQHHPRTSGLPQGRLAGPGRSHPRQDGPPRRVRRRRIPERAIRFGLVTDLHYADKPPAGTRHYRETPASSPKPPSSSPRTSPTSSSNSAT